MDETLTPEQKSDLEEAVAAEMEANGKPMLYNSIIKDVENLHAKVVDLLGREAVGAPAYCRGKAIEKLEEFTHRVHDGMAALEYRQRAVEAAAEKAAADGNIVTLPGAK